MSLSQALLIPGFGGAASTPLAVTSISPESLAQGATAQDITVTGTSFAEGDVASFSGTGVTVNSTTYVNSTTLTVNVTIDGSATTGTRTLTITQGATTAELEDCLTIEFGYLLHDQFTTDDDSPVTSPRTCEPGPGTLTFVQNDGTLAISSGALVFTAQTTPDYADLGFYSSAIVRAAGRSVLTRLYFASTAGQFMFGLNNVAAVGIPAIHTGFYYGDLYNRDVGVNNVVDSVGTAAFQAAHVLRATGAFFLRKLDSASDWTLLWINSTATNSPLYAVAANYNLAPTLDNLRVPTQLWTPTPLVSDNFTRADSSTVGNSAGGGSEESGGTGIACTEVAGNWQISSNTLVTEGDDPGAMDWIITWAAATVSVVAQVQVTLQANSSAGLVFASDGTDWYTVTIDDAANTIRIYEFNGTDTYTQLASTAVAIAAATAYQLLAVRDGATITGYVNGGSRVTVTDASPINATATAHGLYSATAGDAFDNLVIWARTQTLPSF